MKLLISVWHGGDAEFLLYQLFSSYIFSDCFVHLYLYIMFNFTVNCMIHCKVIVLWLLLSACHL